MSNLKITDEVIDIFKQRKIETKGYFKQTEKRLRAYPELIMNIERYTLDIEDLEKEHASSGQARKSKDIVYIPNGGVRLSDDEILVARIALIEKKIKRDKTEINELDYALGAIENEPDKEIIEQKYFQKLSNEEIAEKLSCDTTTVWRKTTRLINMMMIRLYGADAV